MPVKTLLDNATTPVAGLPLDCTGVNKAMLYVTGSTGSFEGEVVFEATLNNMDWFPYEGRLIGGKHIDRLFAGGRAVYFDVEPVQSIRPRVTSLIRGSVTCYGYVEVGKLSGLSYSHVNATGGVLVKSGEGVLHRVVVNDPGASMVLTLYDNITGSGAVIGAVKPSSCQDIEYGLKFVNGLYVVVTATTTGDVTLIFE